MTDTSHPGLRLFALSFTALFLELMLIRWVPSEVKLVAYYANLMLISSFLGLGIGAMLGQSERDLFRWFAVILMLDIALLLGLGWLTLPAGAGEWRFQVGNSPGWSHGVLIALFTFNALTFVPLGQEIGRQFHALPALRAYSWDLGGSLCGTIAFGGFSLLYFSPVLGIGLVALLGFLLGGASRCWRTVPFYLVALGLVVFSGERGAYWSPYHFITVMENYPDPSVSAEVQKESPRALTRPATAAPAEIRTMTDPPIYTVRVNQDFYQLHGTLDLTRYSEGAWQQKWMAGALAQYSLPYLLSDREREVLVLGAGGGMDVEAALLNGAGHVDAVEIDSTMPWLSNRLSAAAPYQQERVTVHIDDARAFLQRSTKKYDMVVFSFLDSQALFSYGTSLRLDGYTYTVESFRRAYELVGEGGVLSVSFYAGTEWMAARLIRMVEEATGQLPIRYVLHPKLVLICRKAGAIQPPAEIALWRLAEFKPDPVALATDDWPYLYLQGRGIPRDYALVIGALLLISTAAVIKLRGQRFGTGDAHFLFMGWGFLLLQTKSIGDCALFFGVTWFVTTLVITGVLGMVLLANWTAIRFIRQFRPWLYLPLLGSLGVVLFVPRELILGQALAVRLAWTLLVVPLPIFFAGLIFSTTFADSENPSASFGANLIGATVGGFCEYLGMWLGSAALGYIIIAAYVISFLCLMASRENAKPMVESIIEAGV